ncbi:hypothetical protein A8C32_10430 [Flavivirga aquatica]|uniref:General secretion pathway protein n=1 Tax=Flavivirga aquatica TaxID=1849968 RepID=A0A1E5TCM8_9FLAO|nr:hypothetical protein [Flavivirga aquatica]OEK09142.1 hypothetical protein A8C32_10430 [Flavivirga aquatica]
MIAKLKNILNNKRYYVLSISIIDGIPEYYLINVFFENNELKIEARHRSNEIDDAFKEYLKKDYPLILHIEGDNIINKSLENKTGYRKSLIFKADLDDFYFYEYKQDNTVFVSVVRKEAINNFIKEINDLNLYVIGLSFGPFVMASLLPIVKNYSTISSPNYTIHINEKGINDFKKESNLNEDYIINEDRFNQNEIPLIASFFNYKFPNDTIEFDTTFLKDNANEFKFKKWFKIAGVFSLLFFLIALFTSHLLHSSYLNTLSEKESVYALSQKTAKEIDKLKQEKALKEKILRTSNINNKSFIAKYIVDIGNSVFPEITLKTINVIPRLRKIERDKKIDFHFNVINIKGEVRNDDVFNVWIKKIKTLKWIEKLDIVDYSQESKRINTFIIKITI